MTPIKVKRLILHPGSPKTGTSSLQNYLYRNRADLRARGILYPETGTPASKDIAKGHHEIALRLPDGASGAKPGLDDLLVALAGELAAVRCDTLILSSEALFGVERLEALRARIAPETTTAYVALRPQPEAMNANYYTAVTHQRISEPPAVYFDRVEDWYAYLPVLEALDRHFAPETLHLRVFEKGQPARRDPIGDFLTALDLPLVAGPGDNTVEHPTLPALHTLLLRHLNEIGVDDAGFFRVFESLHRMEGVLPQQKLTISPDRIRHLQDRFAAENRLIRRRFLDGCDAALFRPAEIPDETAWRRMVGDDHRAAELRAIEYLAAHAAKTGAAAQPAPALAPGAPASRTTLATALN